MKTSQKGIELIKKHEGLRLRSYLCAAGHYTVGFGHTRTAAANLTISRQLAEDLLMQDLQFAEIAVSSSGVLLNQNQFDALVSFAFNLGSTAFRGSSLLKKIRLNASEDEIRHQFSRWVHAKGKPIPGLIARRTDEANLYFLPNTL
jgi:lysozyme